MATAISAAPAIRIDLVRITLLNRDLDGRGRLLLGQRRQEEQAAEDEEDNDDQNN